MAGNKKPPAATSAPSFFDAVAVGVQEILKVLNGEGKASQGAANVQDRLTPKPPRAGGTKK